MGKYTMRPATPEDYQAVLDLDPDNEIYGGNDYLPAEYHRFLQDPHMKITLCLCDGEVVALGMANMVDDGKTLIGMAVRTSSKAKGQGVWRAFRNLGEDVELKTCENFAGVSLSFKTYIQGRGTVHYRAANMLCRRTARDYIMKEDEIQLRHGPIEMRGLVTQLIEPNDSLKLLMDTDTQWVVFPSRRIVCDSGMFIYRLLESNFRRIIANSICITGTVDSNGKCQSMAFGDGRKVHNGYFYKFCYYGHDLNNIGDVMNQVSLHLPLAFERCTKKPMIFRIVMPSQMSEVKVTEAMKLMPGYSKIFRDPLTYYIYERRIHSKSSVL